MYSINAERFAVIANQAMEQGNEDGLRLPNGVRDIDFYDTHSGCVDFQMGGFGLAPSSAYWGVIYTAEDEPVGFQGLDLDFTCDGEGWYWQEEEGDNRCYVIKLNDHWYLYQMWF